MKNQNKIIAIIIVLTLILLKVSADEVYCIDEHTLTCPVGSTQDNITLLNTTSGNTQKLTTSQNSLGIWNATYDFTQIGKYCARCDYTNTSKCFDIVNYCQENLQSNMTNIKTAIDDIQTDIGDPSAEGTTLYARIKSIYTWIQTYIVNKIGVHVG